MSDKKGQVAVILILMAAAALIFYAVSLNLGRISQTKTVTTIAADTAASTLGSYMASFGQSIFKTTLGGKKRVCALTGIVAAVLAVIIAIIAVATGQLYLLEVVALLLALTALVLQLTVIQPGLTDAWNDIIWHTMETRDAFIEQGVQKALTGVVTDNVLVADLDDADGDRQWGLDAGNNPLDKVGRFGFYYQKERIDTIPPPISAVIDEFIDDLRNFTCDNGDNWGLVDGTGPTCTPGPVCDPAGASECDPCCVPSSEWTEEMGCAANVSANPSIYTPDPVDVANVRAACEASSPYGDGTNSNYPWVYDAYHGNATNAFVSFQEQLGRDDEHQLFEKIPGSPNGLQTSILPPPPPLPPTNFQLKDATAYYLNPPEDRTGVFPFFYKIADWGVNLDPATLVINDPVNPQCHWCDADAPGATTCDTTVQPAEIPQLILPVDPATLSYNTTYCVDGAVIGGPNPPLAVDQVKLPNPATNRILADVNQCAQDAVGNSAIGFWKRGGDRFCSNTPPDGWPYWGECPKYGTCPESDEAGGTVDPGCQCGEPGAMSEDNWPDDPLDDLEYGLNFFADWAQDILLKGATPEGVTQLAKDFKYWYPDAAAWIEEGSAAPPTGSSATSDPACTSCCYLCFDENGAPTEDGWLHKWYKAIQEMKGRLEAWRNTSFTGSDCTDVWCVPPAACPGGKDSSALGGLGPESSTFGDANGNGTPGDMEEVVACLNWNVNDRVTTSDGTMTATGNAEKFQQCYAACQGVVLLLDATTALRATELCSTLPRSLVPGFDAIPFVAPNAGAGTTGSCGDAAFMSALNQSGLEAQNQVAKFRKRYTFLSGRLTEMDGIIAALDAAENKFLEFLTCADNDSDGQPDGVACKLIKERINFDSRKTGLPYHAIYGWQGEPEKGQPPGSGKWHIARVDARIPEKCDTACGESQLVNSDPKWPYVRTETDWWERCYILSSTTGVVKARVTRFDETGVFSTLLFPNAVEIWKPTFSRPDRPLPVGLNINDEIMAQCTSSMTPDPGQPSAFPGSYYYGAFMLNERLNNAFDPKCVANCAGVAACIVNCPLVGNAACWDLANQLLSRGVTSEACVKYFYHRQEDGRSGMDFQFVPCLDF